MEARLTRGNPDRLRSSFIRKLFQNYPHCARLAALILLSAAIVPCLRGQARPAASSTGISVELNPQLFATMCALDAAGFDADVITMAEMPSRSALRDDLLKMQGPATEALRQFYRDHALADPAETLSRYITFALVIGPPPQFKYQVSQDLLPPDVLAIDGFREILANFYLEAHLETRWAKVEPEYDRALAPYSAAVRRIVTSTNAYLREVLKPIYGRTFSVYVEPLVGARANFRNLGDHYALVVGTGSPLPLEEIQHAYLHFVLDPLSLNQRDQIEKKSALLSIAARAPRLPVEYQNDFLALADECVVKAVELRLRRLPPEGLEVALAENDRSGFILVRPFVKGLQKFEKAEPAMSYYFPGLIAGLGVQEEQERLRGVTFAPLEPEAAKTGTAPAHDPAWELDRLLEKGDREIALQDAAAATATFESILKKYPDQQRALYGLAVASVLAGNAGRAKELFERLVATPAPSAAGSGKSGEAVDPTIRAWSHVYLGRIRDLEGERDSALHEYRAALGVEGAPEAARVAAQRGVDAAYTPPAHQKRDGNGPQEP
jgi:hypothetical protein